MGDMSSMDFEEYWYNEVGPNDLPVEDFVRVVEMWSGEKAKRVERYAKRKGGKPERVSGPHAEVSHETKDTIMGAITPDDLKEVGCDNPDVYVNARDDDRIVLVRSRAHAQSNGRSRKHVTMRTGQRCTRQRLQEQD
ncbi:hypothetical protein [Dyella acidisoli]|uniref:Uncharacterized protein n=1 Tax=Dyella acidisoli TaxID=1867834 RepID=A0ABQ5XX90_9GAMM|nr:hypothetical protein [Dyella acidisoli]GLQ95151.1 hypothetical protein GCM10007901_41060 [Dyella acidisoli]